MKRLLSLLFFMIVFTMGSNAQIEEFGIGVEELFSNHYNKGETYTGFDIGKTISGGVTISALFGKFFAKNRSFQGSLNWIGENEREQWGADYAMASFFYKKHRLLEKVVDALKLSHLIDYRYYDIHFSIGPSLSYNSIREKHFEPNERLVASPILFENLTFCLQGEIGLSLNIANGNYIGFNHRRIWIPLEAQRKSVLEMRVFKFL